MAGMFYSLKETAEKLKKTEDEIKELVKAGRLREFRDGPNLLFKVDEIQTLMSDTTFMSSQKASGQSEESNEEKPEEATGQEEISIELEAQETSTPEAMPAEEKKEEPVAEETPAEQTKAEEVSLSEDEEEKPETGAEETSAEQTKAEEVSLPEKEEEGTPIEEDITSADTTVTSEGINVLGETESEYPLSEDTKAETQAEAEDASLGEIEGDVNLDSFGSGSGLLDLSLQADDTSLGGILDDIYTSEEEGGEKAAEGSAADVAAEADQMLAEEPAPQAAPVVPGMAQAYAEPAPDTISNAFGIMLFLPLLAVVYTAIVVVTGFKGVIPTIMQNIQGLIWYIMAGVAVASGLIVAIAFMLVTSSTKTAKPKKAKKAKKAKKKTKETPPEATETEEKSD